MRTPGVSIDGSMGCNLHSLKRQLKGLFNEDTHIHAWIKNYLGNIAMENTNLDTSIYTVEQWEASQPHKHSSCMELMMCLGLNPSDNQYYTTIFNNINTMMNNIKHQSSLEILFSLSKIHVLNSKIKWSVFDDNALISKSLTVCIYHTEHLMVQTSTTTDYYLLSSLPYSSHL